MVFLFASIRISANAYPYLKTNCDPKGPQPTWTDHVGIPCGYRSKPYMSKIVSLAVGTFEIRCKGTTFFWTDQIFLEVFLRKFVTYWFQSEEVRGNYCNRYLTTQVGTSSVRNAKSPVRASYSAIHLYADVLLSKIYALSERRTASRKLFKERT